MSNSIFRIKKKKRKKVREGGLSVSDYCKKKNQLSQYVGIKVSFQAKGNTPLYILRTNNKMFKDDIFRSL